MPIYDPKFVKKLVFGVAAALIASIIIRFRHHIYYAILRAITPRTKKKENDEIIRGLHPIFGFKAARFVKELERAGHDVTLNSGYRSPELQGQLYNSGQTPAPPLGSFHNYGMAIDLNVDNLVKASSKSNWQPIGDIGKKYGFRWGGDFSNYDPIHFDDGYKYGMTLLKSLYQAAKLVTNKYVKVF